jgi:PIN domain nuclease of toxin-antitoxin system
MAMTDAVLDASAILAVLNGEPGGDLVVPLLGGGMVSAVNYAEVASKLINSGAAKGEARDAILSLGIDVADFDLELAERTAELRPLTRHRGLSLGDRACLALAEREGVPVVTADRTWKDVLPTVEVRVVR